MSEVRHVVVARGSMRFRLSCRPAFNYARDTHTVEMSPHGVCFHSSSMSLGLSAHIPFTRDGDGVTASFVLHEGESVTFVLQAMEAGGGCSLPLPRKEGERLFEATVRFWRNWISHCTYTGRWREMVRRSALILKLLTFEPTGAIVAAPTSSLPVAKYRPASSNTRKPYAATGATMEGVRWPFLVPTPPGNRGADHLHQ